MSNARLRSRILVCSKASPRQTVPAGLPENGGSMGKHVPTDIRPGRAIFLTGVIPLEVMSDMQFNLLRDPGSSLNPIIFPGPRHNTVARAAYCYLGRPQVLPQGIPTTWRIYQRWSAAHRITQNPPVVHITEARAT
jgi:hypothetical protein